MTVKTLLLEPFGGLAGDMLLASLLDLGESTFTLDHLLELAEKLVPGEARLSTKEVQRGAFRACLLSVETPETKAPPERHLSDLVRLLERAPLSATAQERALAVLTRLAQAEARVHGTTVERVHFHEVGAVDTLIDVAGAVFALECLGVERVLSRPPYVGGGTVRGAHGLMPVPAPGTAEILRGIPHELGVGGERLTPTGAALVAVLTDSFIGPDGALFRGHALGHGAGSREPREGPANFLRVQLGEWQEDQASAAQSNSPWVAGSSGGAQHHRVWLLELNLDDTTPEEVGFLLECLRSAGALEAWTQPLQMKKDRPGVLVAALARASEREALERACFDNSATLGVRWSPRERTELGRSTLTVDLAPRLGLEKAEVQVVHRDRGIEWGAEVGPEDLSSLDLSPEYDDLARLARACGRPLREIEALALAAARELLKKRS